MVDHMYRSISATKLRSMLPEIMKVQLLNFFGNISSAGKILVKMFITSGHYVNIDFFYTTIKIS